MVATYLSIWLMFSLVLRTRVRVALFHIYIVPGVALISNFVLPMIDIDFFNCACGNELFFVFVLSYYSLIFGTNVYLRLRTLHGHLNCVFLLRTTTDFVNLSYFRSSVWHQKF